MPVPLGFLLLFSEQCFDRKQYELDGTCVLVAAS